MSKVMMVVAMVAVVGGCTSASPVGPGRLDCDATIYADSTTLAVDSMKIHNCEEATDASG